ncbi:MAG: hypothetical protein AB7P12_16965 [Alphaproteobacteria bacterium]
MARLLTRAHRLTAYLRGEARFPHAWGTHDCALFIADWVRAETGSDPGACVRGAYATEEAADRYLSGYGGLAMTVARAMRQAGLRMTKTVAPGDVALILAGDQLCCAIRTATRYATRMRTSLCLLPLENVRLITGWKV